MTRALAFVAIAGLAIAQPPGDESGDPLDQVIDAGQQVATGNAVLDHGHVDIGPRHADGELTLMVHDDSVIPSVWRSLDDVVLHVTDDALQTVPDDPAYSFLGVEPGTDVHVVPQVEQPGVVWVGWNTQEPGAMAALDRGATLTLLDVEGPGELVMFLQAGNLSEPDVLWQSAIAEPQPIWVEVNTHTHANWVFTESGVYLVQVEVAADLIGGEHARDVRTLRFAVGDATRPDDALAAVALPVASADGPSADSADGAGTGLADGAESAGDGGGDDGGGGVVVALVAGGAVLLAAAVVWVIARGRSAKRRAEAERQAAP